ncbi:hypothetical protein NQZ79_g7109 [Umbelopsis isabellina]|nr:hypothetical protein NQZ79_g7109 [Umbelopsis isabellina]
MRRQGGGLLIQGEFCVQPKLLSFSSSMFGFRQAHQDAQPPQDTIDEADVKLSEDKVVDDELWKAVMSDIDTIFDDSKAT